VRFRIALPGNNRIPPANDHVPDMADWIPGLTAPQFQEIASAIDGLGYSSITTSEHLAMPYEVRVDASVLVLPYYHPLAFAKALSTIDVLSGGRLDVSVGVGHAVREFEVLGVPFDERGAITDEILEATLILWSEDKPSYHSAHFDIDGLAFEPKPVQSPRPPIFVGGNSKPALRRAARYEGWEPNPTTFSVEEMPPLLDYLRSQPEFAGKESTFDVCWVGTIPGIERPAFGDLSEAGRTAHRDQILESLAYLETFGIVSTSVPIPVTRSLAEYIDYITWFSDSVIVAGA
jgi:alkanesulfonate monooxygenase SsuD/methylene tetrahydromethanopterin reductase-like flavin-dependent oxidoreductase (luciferase family)